MATTRTKAVVALGLLDIVRQATHAVAARQQARRDHPRARSEALARLAEESRERARAVARVVSGAPPKVTLGDRLRTWLPVLVVMAASTAAVVLAARVIARREGSDPDAMVTDSRMIGAVRASSRAIDASVEKVTAGGSAAAATTAATIGAGSAAVRQAAVRHAKDEVAERVVQPVRRKVTFYGAVGFVALTVYVVVLAAAVQLAVDAAS